MSINVKVSTRKTVALNAKATPKATIHYQSLNTKVAKVSNKGVVTGVRQGNNWRRKYMNDLRSKIDALQKQQFGEINELHSKRTADLLQVIHYIGKEVSS